MKTIRFRLALIYSVFLVLMLAIINIGVYIAFTNSRVPIADMMPFYRDTMAWLEVIQHERDVSINDLRNYSLIGAGAVMILGVVGGYFLSGFMLKPVDRVSVLASRISDNNLKERIKHNGPDDEIKRLSDTFDGMLGRLENTFELQKQFIQDASHELRTPLAIAQTNIEVLEMEESATVEDYKQLVSLLKMSLARINDVSNSLLLLSEGTVLPIHMVRVDLHTLMSEVYEEAKIKVQSAGLQFEWQPSGEYLYVRGDAVRLKQAVINLVDNATKYNRPNGMVRIKAWSESNNAVIEVSDSGIGISDADLPRIFDRFFCADKSRSREHGGSGLGLAIVKKIVEDHGGTVTTQSVDGHGSAFYIKLPLLSY
ncbi:MAG: HAMP domain-containing histidine kinase [Dehalococcoidia bacterium]|nr:HAMP domain-containing histidine kinase [Dehalococcoidia bacterium]